MNLLECYPNCNIAVGNRRWPVSTAISHFPCAGPSRIPFEFVINIHLPSGRQRSAFKFQPPPIYNTEYESHLIGSDSYLANLEVKFTEENAHEFYVNACITPQDSSRVCFMDQLISKHEIYRQSSCGDGRGSSNFLFVSALIVFVCLLIGMAATVIIYRFYRRYKARRPSREFEPIISDMHKFSTCSPPRPFHAQLTVVMEEEEDKCSPSTPIKDFFWRSASPTPVNTPRSTISMQRTSPLLSSLLPEKKPTPKPTMV